MMAEVISCVLFCTFVDLSGDKEAAMLAACRILVAASLLATIASTLSVYPHSLAYFNELAGGPENGYKHLLGSNLDWGQDFLLARDWMREHPLPPEAVRVASYGSLTPTSGLLLTESIPGRGAARWEIVSANQVASANSRWRGQLLKGSGCRIGSTMWAFPMYRNPTEVNLSRDIAALPI